MPKNAYEKPYDTNGFPITEVYTPGVGAVAVQGGPVTTDNSTTAKTQSAPIAIAYGDAFAYANCPSAATTVVKNIAGRCCRVIVLATGTGIATIYDNTAGSGQAVVQVPASAPLGLFGEFQIPCKTGITVVSAASGPVLLVTYN